MPEFRRLVTSKVRSLEPPGSLNVKFAGLVIRASSDPSRKMP